ncbi:MAG: hypothetical protein B5M53_03765 [Candidatus Cloacimonas sp. 4484_209]|nr:MAG: hypothetical protein B5M53_03765 [Candidatus Cloacimonas sp. 4484_209]
MTLILITFIALNTFFFESVVPHVFHLSLMDVSLLLIIFLSLIKLSLVKTPLKFTQLDLMIALWIYYISIVGVYTRYHGPDSRSILREGSIFLYFAAGYYITRSTIKDEKSLRLLVNATIGIAVLAGILGVLVGIFPASPLSSFFFGKLPENWLIKRAYGVEWITITFPSHALILFAATLSTITFIYEKRFRYLFITALLTTIIIGTFTRTLILLVLVMIIISFLITLRSKKWNIKFIFFGLSSMSILIYLLSYVLMHFVLSESWIPLVMRLSEMGSVQNLFHGTLSVRSEEILAAMDKLKETPFFGIGLGTPYITRYVIYSGSVEQTSYIHNAHMGIALKTGLIGFTLFFLISFVYLKQSVKLLQHINSSYQKKVLITSIIAYVLILIADMTICIHLLQPNSFVIGVIFAYTPIIQRLKKLKR